MLALGEMNINLNDSWMIGDGLIDVKAGNGAGCKTVLLARMKCELCQLMSEMNTHPDFIVSSLPEVVELVSSQVV